MAGPNKTVKLHPSKRHNNPDLYKSGEPRLRGLNLGKLVDLIKKSSKRKNQSKINREIARRFGIENCVAIPRD